MQRRLSLAFVATLLLVNLATAQESYARKQTRAGSGYFMLGWNKPDFDALIASLQTQGYPAFDDEVVSFGGGGHFYLNRLLLGGEGHAFKNKTNRVALASGEYKATLSAGYGLFTLGYLLLPYDRLQFYPMLGFGGGGSNLKIIPTNKPSFTDVLNDPGRTSELSQGGLLLNLGFGADTWLGIHRERRDYNGVVLGLRAGYLFTPLSGDWHLLEDEITGGPEYDFTGPYARVLLGLGAVGKR